MVNSPNKPDAGRPVTASESIRYPGVGRMFLFWVTIGALTIVRSQLSFGPAGRSRETISYLLACVSWYVPWSFLSPLAFRIERRFPLGASGWLRNVLVLAAMSIPFCLVASPLMLLIFGAVRYAFGTPLNFTASFGFWASLLPSAEGIFWCSIAGGYFLRTLFQLHEHEKQSARLALEKTQLESSLNQAQLEALRARLNPHFLFNSLQNISVLTKQDPETASRMLTVLGDLLRAVLRSDSQPESTLSEEIDLTKAYVALEKMRFAERLRVTFEVSEEVAQAMVPCFLMQPFLENAIKHGLRGVQKTGVIVVRAIAEERRLVITVADNGVGTPANESDMKIGVGLGSSCERLARMYPDSHEFSISRPPAGGTEVRIGIPLRFTNASAEARAATSNRAMASFR